MKFFALFLILLNFFGLFTAKTIYSQGFDSQLKEPLIKKNVNKSSSKNQAKFNQQLVKKLKARKLKLQIDKLMAVMSEEDPEQFAVMNKLTFDQKKRYLSQLSDGNNSGGGSFFQRNKNFLLGGAGVALSLIIPRIMQNYNLHHLEREASFLREKLKLSKERKMDDLSKIERSVGKLEDDLVLLTQSSSSKILELNSFVDEFRY